MKSQKVNRRTGPEIGELKVGVDVRRVADVGGAQQGDVENRVLLAKHDVLCGTVYALLHYSIHFIPGTTLSDSNQLPSSNFCG